MSDFITVLEPIMVRVVQKKTKQEGEQHIYIDTNTHFSLARCCL